MLSGILAHRRKYALRDGERYLDAVQNARLAANAERYYRTMYYGSRASWNLRDMHMFETLKTLLNFHGPGSKAIVWAHNSPVGDAAATEISIRDEFNLGELCRREFGDSAYLIGLGTNSGTVAAASDWDGPMEVKSVRPAIAKSFERQCHAVSEEAAASDWDGPMEVKSVRSAIAKSYERQCHAVSEETGDRQFMLPLSVNMTAGLRELLETPRLERAIGVIYRPETELASHYFQAVLPRQFDEYISGLTRRGR